MVRSFELSKLDDLRTYSHLPIFVNISHALRKHGVLVPEVVHHVFEKVDGLILEVHQNPEKALLGTEHMLRLDEAEALIVSLRELPTTSKLPARDG